MEAVPRQARRLPDCDRLRLADELRASVPDDISAEWDDLAM
jgi:hypothetical protein